MQEIEIKIFGVDLEEVRKKMTDFGAEVLFDGVLKMRSFDFPDGRLKKNGSMMRLYLEGKKVLFVFKKKRPDKGACKFCDEVEVEVADFEGTSDFLKRLGFVLIVDRTRKRTSFYYKNIHFDLDLYPDGFSYMEIEAASPELVEEGTRLLGLEDHEKSSKSVDEIFS